MKLKKKIKSRGIARNFVVEKNSKSGGIVKNFYLIFFPSPEACSLSLGA